MKDKIRIRGMVTVTVRDKDGSVKRRTPCYLGRLLGLRGTPMLYKKHNIVTREGDALIADALLDVPAKVKVSGASGYIQVGTGWTGNSAKTNTRCNTPAGSMKLLDNGYPALKSPWGTTGDTTIQYRATFAAGDLDASGINECCLLNGNAADANCLAYAQITPSANVSPSDTLQVLWEITFLGQ